MGGMGFEIFLLGGDIARAGGAGAGTPAWCEGPPGGPDVWCEGPPGGGPGRLTAGWAAASGGAAGNGGAAPELRRGSSERGSGSRLSTLGILNGESGVTGREGRGGASASPADPSSAGFTTSGGGLAGSRGSGV